MMHDQHLPTQSPNVPRRKQLVGEAIMIQLEYLENNSHLGYARNFGPTKKILRLC